MESFPDDFKAAAQHVNEELTASILQSYHQYNDATRTFKGKNKISVLSQSQFTRNNLADAAFSLKEVCETLMSAIINIVQVPKTTDQSSIVNEVSNKMQTTLVSMMKDFEKNLLEKMQVTTTPSKSPLVINEVPKETHVIYIR